MSPCTMPMNVLDMQPTSTEVEVLVEGLLESPDVLAALHPGCSLESRVLVDVVGSRLFNVTMVSSLNTELDLLIAKQVGTSNNSLESFS